MRFFSVLVVVVFLFNSILPNAAEGSWLRVRQGHVTPQFWVDTSRHVTREIGVSPARTIPAVTERRWVETSPARPAVGHWETTERRWVETVAARPAQGGWERTHRQWAETVPARPEVWGWGWFQSDWEPPYPGWEPPGGWGEWDPPMEWRYGLLQHGTPAQGVWLTVVLAPGQPVPPVETRQVVTQAAQWGWYWEVIGYDFEEGVGPDGEWRVLRWPIYGLAWGIVVPERREWAAVTTDPNPLSTRWVQTSPAIPAQGEWRDVVVGTSPTPPATEWRWVQTSPAVVARAAVHEWRNVEVAPGGWESVWMPPTTQTRLVRVAEAIPPVTETRVVATHPGRWEEVWVPPVTRTETIRVSPGIPPITGTREVIVSPARSEVRTIPAVTRTERVLIHPGREAVWEERTTGGREHWRWVETRAAVPAVHETREVEVSPARTIPAVTRSVWVQTAPAQPAKAAEGHWEPVSAPPPQGYHPEDDIGGGGGGGGGFGGGRTGGGGAGGTWGPQLRWVQTSPAEPAVPAQGYWDTVEISPAREIPAVTQMQTVLVSPGVPAEGGMQLVTTGGTTQRILVVPEQPPIYDNREVVVSPATTEIVMIPAVTRTETVELSPGVPARYETRETVEKPGEWEQVWVSPRTETITVEVSPGVAARYEERTETLPGRYENVRVPPVTEMRLVEVSPAVEARTAEGRWELVTADPNRTTRWVETSPAVAAQGRYEDVVVSPAVVLPAVTRTETVWEQSGHWQSLAGTITVERDREFVLTHRWRPDYQAFDMVLTVTHALNREVTGIQAVHVLDRFQGMGQMFVYPTAIPGGPNRHGFGFTYTHPGQPSSTVHITLHFAGGETFRFEMQIPVNGITVTQRRGVGPLDLQRAVARVGTITLP